MNSKLAFVFVTGLVGVGWCVVLPWLSDRPIVRQRLQFLESRGIDPSAMYYTELDAMDAILDRLEGSGLGREQNGPAGESADDRTPVRLVLAKRDEYPSGELGEVIRLGESLVQQTSEHPLTKPFVGNKLNCTSCHLDAGRHPKAATFVGVAAAYPAFSPREKRVLTLEDRILNCFIRSQNGSRPPNGGTVSVAIAAYITWLSTESPIRMNAAQPLGPNHLPLLETVDYQPDIERGKRLYADRCAACHADDGVGTDDGPPVWGDDSYNDGAGLSKVPKLASWLKVAMPLDETDLRDQEAFDIAAFVNSHSRPKFGLGDPD